MLIFFIELSVLKVKKWFTVTTFETRAVVYHLYLKISDKINSFITQVNDRRRVNRSGTFSKI